MIKVKTRNMIDDQVENEFFKKFNAIADEGYETMARLCAMYAISGINMHTGNLQLSIKASKSKFKEGGWICIAEGGKKGMGNHAFLVEYGTDGPRKPLLKKKMKFEIDGKVIFAEVVAKMPAQPFMRPARDLVISLLRRSLK